MTALRPLLIALLSAGLVGACGDDSPVEGPTPPLILSVELPNPVLQGSLLRVTGLNFEWLGASPRLRIEARGLGASLPLDSDVAPGELLFSVTGTLLGTLGSGTHAATAVLEGDLSSAPYDLSLTIARTLPVALTTVPTGDVHRNDLAVFGGAGFLAAEEGLVEARFVGDFTPSVGPVVPVDVWLPLMPATRFARDRGVVRLSTAIGGVRPGGFVGTVELRAMAVSGDRSTAPAMPVNLRFQRPELFAVLPPVASLEQLVTISGAGFLGGPLDPDETTLIRLEGTFTQIAGMGVPFGPNELVLAFLSGSEVRGPIESVKRRGALVSTLFDARSGVFDGMATPIVLKGAIEVTGAATPFRFELGPVTQVVFVKFLPGFYDSLALFGLAASAGTIEGIVAERIRGIYMGWMVDVRLERPQDYSPNGYATVEIGGPDPNGIGLFGYDNTPGKDVNNLRLHDAMGGTNAETQADGSPGYGGVFVESMLFFSARPGLPRPPSSPTADPLFDEIFDPVRNSPATLAEVGGSGPAARTAAVDRAMRALASMVGETSAHELGHSLGLAAPRGSRTVYHNRVAGDGCVMDSGGSRPVGERAAQSGFTPTHFCGDAPAYLDEILGM